MKPGIVKDKSYAFALQTPALAQRLKGRKKFDIARQILRSGTAIGSNVEEALVGASRADFTAKMSTASKEAGEIHHSLRLLRDSKIVPKSRLSPFENESLKRAGILTGILKATQTGEANSKPRIQN